MALTVSGLVIAGGVALAGPPANASTGQEKVTVAPRSSVYTESVATVTDRPPRCRHYVRGHMRHYRGKNIFVRGYWMPRGCVHHR
ncbi:hypothetical protein NE236_32945 [Actinoallomurus purpureus]|uniref:hypothetical protein n=1 Tax=Actinoallomurus purpureus TaxID=478114 RepID=UPI002093E05B|nr:hypothetical protein [Actinoallomurus purpureus]MCO6009790.1 hypothetical protein [Actinoallomurus purpureus]